MKLGDERGLFCPETAVWILASGFEWRGQEDDRCAGNEMPEDNM